MPKHPHHFAFLAILFGLLAIGLALVAEVSVRAEDNIGTVTTISNNTSSSATDTTTTTTSSSSAITAIETEKIETVTACNYTYSSWSACSTSGVQTRSVTAKTPSGCQSSAEPILKQPCTYVPPTIQRTACIYALSDWSTCNSSGTQNRNILSRNPIGCYDANMPSLQRTCTYNSTVIFNSNRNTTTSTASATSIGNTTTSTGNSSENSDGNTTTSNSTSSAISSGNTMSNNTTLQNFSVTPAFNFLNINGGEVISGSVKIQGTVNSAYRVEFYLVPVGSNTPKYLGLAKKIEGNIWEYPLDSQKQPNGSYYIRVKIKNAYGSYEGGQRMLVVLNVVEGSETVLNSELPRKETETLNSQANQEKAIPTDQTDSEWQKKYFKADTCVDKNICGGMADPDKDGITNNDEYRYGTNPTNPDSDGDGFLDGDEAANGYNPLKSSPGDKSDKIIFESPKENGEIKKDFYQVNNVEMIPDSGGNKKLKISGKGIPNSFVTLYIYSDPIILTVKTDNDGNWSYEIDKDIEEGEHQVYVAVTDNTGKITAKSEPLMFVKTAQAATIIPPAQAAVTDNSVSQTKNKAEKDIFFLLALIIGGLALALASIGLYKHNAYKKEINNIN